MKILKCDSTVKMPFSAGGVSIEFTNWIFALWELKVQFALNYMFKPKTSLQ